MSRGKTQSRTKTLPQSEMRRLYWLGVKIIDLLEILPEIDYVFPSTIRDTLTFRSIQQYMNEIRKMPRRLRGDRKLYKLSIEIRDSLTSKFTLSEEELNEIYNKEGEEELRKYISKVMLSILKDVLYYLYSPHPWGE